MDCLALSARQAASATTEDGKAASAPPKINEFRNKFEKFGAPTSKFPTRKPPPPGPSLPAAAGVTGSGVSGSEAMDKASREARELAQQLQQQMTQLEQSRIAERQQLVDKLETRDAQLKTINDRNAAVSYCSNNKNNHPSIIPPLSLHIFVNLPNTPLAFPNLALMSLSQLLLSCMMLPR